MVRVIAFDVNETLLDLRALDAEFEKLFASAAVRVQWFTQMLQLSFVGGLTGHYVDFSTAQGAALNMIAQRSGVEVSQEQVSAMVDRMSTLPPHPEVPTALAKLREGPVKIAALTNSRLPVAEAQLANAGLRHLFDEVISADTVRRLKPAPEPYHSVADTFGVPIDQVRLVAAHSWDITGALAAGAKAAFVARPGMVLSPIGMQPDIVGKDLEQVIDLIRERDR